MPFYFYINIGAELLAVICGTYFLRRRGSKFHFLYAFVWVAFLTELLLNGMVIYGVKNNLVISHVYFPLEFLLIALLYLKHLTQKKFVLVVMSAFLVISILNPLFFQKINEYSKIRSLSSVLLILFSVQYFYKVMAEANIKRLVSEPMIWINTAVLFYFSSGLFYNVLFSLVLNYSREFSKLINSYFTFFNIVFYSLISIGFWKAGKQKIKT